MGWRRKLGLTRQFNCRECGFPIHEEYASIYFYTPRPDWRWVCERCGWESSRTHALRVMKRQHRFWLFFRKCATRV